MYMISGSKFYGRKGVMPWVVMVAGKAYPVSSKSLGQKMMDDIKAKGYQNVA